MTLSAKLVNTYDMPPNIVIILADDMGMGDLGCYGNADASTPHLDRLSQNSIRHEAFYVTPVCAPTRAELLTGRHYLRVGVAGVHGGKDHINLSERLLPEILRDSGYATGTWGKWHSGNAEGYKPYQRGFDETLQLKLYKHRDPIGTPNGGTPIHFDGKWADDVIAEYTLDFAQRHAGQPFFALFSSMTPHGRLDAPEAEIERLMETQHLSRNLATLHAQMSLFDRAVGRLISGLEALDCNGRETIVIFLSDNGPAMFEDVFTDAERAKRNGLPTRGWKGDVWEGGIRSPLFIHRIGHSDHRTIVQPADITDLLPTIAAWAGIPLQPDNKPLDGRNIQPMLEGDTMPDKAIPSWVHPAIPPAPNRSEARKLQKENRPLSLDEKQALTPDTQVMALRVGDWKLSYNADINRPGGPYPRYFLADLTADPGETTDLSSENPAQATLLHKELDHWFEAILEEPQSFQPVELQVPPQGNVMILSNWACYVDDSLYNKVPVTEGFNKAGQTVRWSLNVEETREVTPELIWFGGKTPPVGSRLSLECSGSESIGTVMPDGSTRWNFPLHLDAGPNTLELKVIAMPPPEHPLSLLIVNLLEDTPAKTH